MFQRNSDLEHEDPAMEDAECAINYTTYQTMYYSIRNKKRRTICLPQLPLIAKLNTLSSTLT